jgi:hypothetical protein
VSWVLEVRSINNATISGTFSRIADLGGNQVKVISLARGGFPITRHVEDQATLSTPKK